MSKVLAFDFGASSGRAILATYNGDNFSYKEIHRFENVPISLNNTLHWDFDNLMKNIHEGVQKAGEFDSLAFDTWGVDYGLLDEQGELIENPFHYRDARTEGMVEKAFNTMTACEIYAQTGNQIMNINTLFQLLAADCSKAKTLLFMPDLFAYMLCGKAVCEVSIASTSQMLNPTTKKLSDEVLAKFNINKSLFAPIVKSGTVIGTYKNAKVIAACGHDTQCAVAALPTNAENVAFLSCGTWSLLGTELREPILSEASMKSALSNEIGANGKINYLKNIIGLWLIQESRREWQRQGKAYSYADLERLALAEKPLQCFIDPDAKEFASLGDIPSRVQEYCKKTNQYVPQTVGEIMRCIYESLALKYSYAMKQLSAQSQKSFDALHILGGGTKDKLLCQMTANACHIKVVAGPIEATALGNIIIQLIALGDLQNIEQGRNLIQKSEALLSYIPSEDAEWTQANEKFEIIINGGNK